MTFLDHLDELRKSLFRSLIGLFIVSFGVYWFVPQIQEILIAPFIAREGATLSLLTPTEGFVVSLKLSLVAGLFLSAPWIFYQLWSFIAPGLFEHERKLVLPVVFFSSFNFILGACFAYFVLPYATSFFLGFSTETVANLWSLGKYLDFILRIFLAFGVVFELPVLIYFLARFGIVTPEFLRKYRRHAYILVLVAASIITPPDIFTQVVLAMPMVILYEISIFIAISARKKWLASISYNPDDEPELEKNHG